MKKILTSIALSLAAICGTAEAQTKDTVYSYEWTTLHEWIEQETPTILSEHFEGKDYDEALCLAVNIYHEARSSTYYDMSSTAHVVLNRRDAAGFRDSICGVVWQPKQFSWTHDGKSDRPYETEAWLVAQFVAFMVLKDYSADQTQGADHYHTTAVNPGWSKHGVNRKTIGAHEYMLVKHPIIPKKK